jgi:hypothetical protein
MWLIDAFNYSYEMRPSKTSDLQSIKRRLAARDVSRTLYIQNLVFSKDVTAKHFVTM